MKNKSLKIAKILIGIPLLIFVLGYFTMHLWNWLVPTLFNGPTINIWQTLGLVLLSKILFGGFKGGGMCCCHNRGEGTWKSHMKAKWDNLSTEERSTLKSKFFSKCYPKNNSNNDECCN
jgi:hypothetical protein